MGRRRRRRSGGAGQVLDIAGAEKKLRQAEFFLGCLEHTSELTRHRANHLYGGESEHLEFFFSACLSAAQSVYYVLDKTGGEKFKDVQRDWRRDLKDDSERSRFGKMIALRDKDVHLGTTGAKPLPKYVEEDRRDQSSHYYPAQIYNVALFGEMPVIEEVNPDGKTVKASVLRGTLGLYLDQHSSFVEATTACRGFIDQLRSLLDAVRATI